MYEVLVMAEQLKPLWADHLFPVRLHYLSKNRAYYPTNTDIRNHVYKAQRACQLLKLDQLRLKIEQWQNKLHSLTSTSTPIYKSTLDSDKESLEEESIYT